MVLISKKNIQKSMRDPKKVKLDFLKKIVKNILFRSSLFERIGNN